MSNQFKPSNCKLCGASEYQCSCYDPATDNKRKKLLRGNRRLIKAAHKAHQENRESFFI